MRPGLYFLPLFGFLAGLIASSVGSTFQNNLITAAGWGLCFFLVSTWLWIERTALLQIFSRKGTKYGASSGLHVLIQLALIIGIGYLTTLSRFDQNWDLTKNETNTLSPQSLKIIDQIGKISKTNKQTISVHGYFSNPEAQVAFKKLLDRYKSAGLKFEIKHTNPLQNPMVVQSEQLTNEDTAKFNLGDKTQYMTVFTEQELSNTLLRLGSDTLKVIYFTQGHGEGNYTSQDPVGLGKFVELLNYFAYTSKSLDINQQEGVPLDASAVVISGPRFDFNEFETKALESFILRGGSLLVGLDAFSKTNNLNQLLLKYGVEIRNDFMGMPQAGQNIAQVGEFNPAHNISSPLQGPRSLNFIVQNARSLKVNPEANFVNTEVLAESLSDTFRVKNIKNPEDLKNISQDQLDPLPQAMAVAVKIDLAAKKKSAAGDIDQAGSSLQQAPSTQQPKGSSANLIVFGSSSPLSNAVTLEQNPIQKVFALNALKFVLDQKELITIPNKAAFASKLETRSSASKFSLILTSFLFPLCILIAGFWHVALRKKSQLKKSPPPQPQAT